MLDSTIHEISTAHSLTKLTTESVDIFLNDVLFIQNAYIYEQDKFHAQLCWAWPRGKIIHPARYENGMRKDNISAARGRKLN